MKKMIALHTTYMVDPLIWIDIGQISAFTKARDGRSGSWVHLVGVSEPISVKEEPGAVWDAIHEWEDTWEEIERDNAAWRDNKNRKDENE